MKNEPPPVAQIEERERGVYNCVFFSFFIRHKMRAHEILCFWLFFQFGQG